MGFLKEFKEFAMKGSIIDLAVAVIIGAAFGKIITSLVDNIIMPIVGSIIGQDFKGLILFMMIKVMNKIKKKKEVVTPPSSTDVLLMEIRDVLKSKP